MHNIQFTFISVSRQCELLEVNRTSIYYTPSKPDRERETVIKRGIGFWHTKMPYILQMRSVGRRYKKSKNYSFSVCEELVVAGPFSRAYSAVGSLFLSRYSSFQFIEHLILNPVSGSNIAIVFPLHTLPPFLPSGTHRGPDNNCQSRHSTFFCRQISRRWAGSLPASTLDLI